MSRTIKEDAFLLTGIGKLIEPRLTHLGEYIVALADDPKAGHIIRYNLAKVRQDLGILMETLDRIESQTEGAE